MSKKGEEGCGYREERLCIIEAEGNGGRGMESTSGMGFVGVRGGAEEGRGWGRKGGQRVRETGGGGDAFKGGAHSEEGEGL